MRSLRLTLLLLLLLPGLLLPAGALLRICLCDHPAAGLGASSCCAPASAELAPRSACCATAEASSEPSPQDPGIRAARGADCRCVLLQVEEEPPESERPREESAPVLALLPEPRVELRELASLLRVRSFAPHRELRPPPDHQRTLPLLL
ncbi:MAG: hypothetical protein IPN34_22105 [Planctomycetes bacterium]|nr:hypothetical protein [Planctomycetota bacterium]